MTAVQPKLVELVQDAVLAEIASGKMPAGQRIAEQQVARELGVPRQAVQQALAVLRSLGVVCDVPGGGAQVAPLDLDHVRDMYDMRAVLEGLAFRKAAERNPRRAALEGPSYIADGRAAVAAGDMERMIEADMGFHAFIYELSGNPLVAPSMDKHWTDTQRVMGEVLIRGERPRDVWDQHQALLDAVVAGDADRAEKLARDHIDQAADITIERLRQERTPH
jgi:DNA-binding GntR family transcriptional regulator